jgi:hypothetical protein
MSNREELWQELTRLVAEYQSGEGSEREEAWNLLADFTLENWIEIAGALEFATMHAPSPDPFERS